MNSEPWEPCHLCAQSPRDRQGHDKLLPRLESLDRRMRSRVWLTFQCTQCATKWSRHRAGPADFEWRRVL